MSSVAARFFLPQVAGLPIIPAAHEVFRIDHDELFNETTHLQYQPFKRGSWLSFNWRYDSGLVAGATPCSAATASCFSSTPIAAGGGAKNDDHNPQRIQPRKLFDIAVGHDYIFHGDKYKFSARLEVINLTDKEALYNF